MAEERLWRAFVELFRHWERQTTAGREAVVEVLAAVSEAKPAGPLTPYIPPVVYQYLTPELSLPDNEALATACRELVAARDKLIWQELPPEYAGPELAGGFAFTRLVGPLDEFATPPLYVAENIVAGFSLQAPGLFYRAHWHPAVELYGVLCGTAEWQLGQAPFVERPPGSLIFHDSNVWHAMNTLAEPLLTFYAWTGDIKGRIVVEW